MDKLRSSTCSAHERIVIVGAGIVGSCLARLLRGKYKEIVLVDQDVAGLPGSTGHAPGFVGQLNEIDTLTRLAKQSVAHYTTIQGGLNVVGGLEVAHSKEGKANLEARHASATKHGLKSRLLTPHEAVQLAPEFVDVNKTVAALHFPSDGTANAQHIARSEQQASSALLVDASVLRLLFSDDDAVTIKGVETDKGIIEAGNVVLCTGIWAAQMLPYLPVVPVAHPYTFFASRSEKREKATPFVRWPEHHVYARDHGLRDGMGSYAHAPCVVEADQLGTTAFGKWDSDFDEILSQGAKEVLPRDITRESTFNGLFSVTPDGLPLVGRTRTAGLFCAVAVWVTHAYGAATVLADILAGEKGDETLDPLRFEGQEMDSLKNKAAAMYNDVYNKQARKTN